MSDTCGAETATGEPCTHPPTEADDRCWIHTDDDPKPGGRPSLLSEYEEDILTGARQGMTMQGLARLAGVDESNLYRYLDRNEGFRKSLKRARAQGELQHLRSVNDSGSRFVLERSFGYQKTEKKELEHSGDGGGALEVVINETVVDEDDSSE